jgi:hypothetical protein
MRSGAEHIAREELARIAGELPPEIRLSMERVLLRTVHRLMHKPTLELRAAAEADDGDLVSVLAGLFDANGCGTAIATSSEAPWSTGQAAHRTEDQIGPVMPPPASLGGTAVRGTAR